MNNIVFLFVIALISVGAGVAIGILIASLRTEKPVGSSQPKSRGNLIETARIMQDRKTGSPLLEVNGKTIQDPSDLSPNQRQQLTAQVQTLLNWLKPSQVDMPGLPAEAPIPPGAAQTTSAAPVVLPETPPVVTKMGPIDLLARSISPEARPVTRGPQSIVAQIDEILQSKLADSPLAERGIRLMEMPTKGLVVMVGLQQYEEVDAVPDPEIRALIRQSVDEWEKSQTQG
jgi:hypothetical protein